MDIKIKVRGMGKLINRLKALEGAGEMSAENMEKALRRAASKIYLESRRGTSELSLAYHLSEGVGR